MLGTWFGVLPRPGSCVYPQNGLWWVDIEARGREVGQGDSCGLVQGWAVVRGQPSA